MKMDVLEKIIDEFVTKDSSNKTANQITSKAIEKKIENENKCNCAETEHDSKEERNAWCMLRLDEENKSDFNNYSTSDDCSDCPSNFNELAKWNEKRWKHKRKVKSHSD